MTDTRTENSPWKKTAASLAALTLVIPSAFAAEESTALPAEVDRILKNMSDYLGSVDEFTFQADILFDEVLPSGQAIQHGAEVKAAVHRPDKLAGKFESDTASRTMWYDGKTVTMLDADKEVFATASVPDKIDAALDHLMEKYGFSMPLADFVSDDVYKSLTAHVGHASYIGKTNVGGRTCDHLAFSQDAIDWQLWVEDGIRRLPRKIVITYKLEPGEPIYMAEFSNWDLGASLPALLFTAAPPADATRIDLLEVEKIRPGN